MFLDQRWRGIFMLKTLRVYNLNTPKHVEIPSWWVGVGGIYVENPKGFQFNLNTPKQVEIPSWWVGGGYLG